MPTSQMNSKGCSSKVLLLRDANAAGYPAGEAAPNPSRESTVSPSALNFPGAVSSCWDFKQSAAMSGVS